jgi:hypothetical protein
MLHWLMMNLLFARKVVFAAGTEEQLMRILRLRVPHEVHKENSRRDSRSTLKIYTIYLFITIVCVGIYNHINS